MGKKKSRGAGGVIMLLLLCLAVLGLFFWQGVNRNYKKLSTQLNESLSGLLAKQGLNGSFIVDASTSDHREGITVWKEYYRKIQLPDSTDIKALTARLSEAAKKYRLTIVKKESGSGTVTVEIRRGDKVLSHLVFMLATRKAEPEQAVHPSKRFVLVIDDIGGKRDLSSLLDLGVPLTFAIMPYEPFSRKIASDLAERHMPFIMHLPLEPEAYPKVDPGKAALLIKMTDEQLRKKFASDLATVPGVRGVSNHMGSRFSQDPEKMKLMLELVKAQGLFYFDSYTTPKSIAGKAARGVGVPFKVNDLFVDLEDTPEFMSKQFDRILQKFEHTDNFIAIGHVQKKNLVPVLKAYIPKFKESGIEFVYLTDLVYPQKDH